MNVRYAENLLNFEKNNIRETYFDMTRREEILSIAGQAVNGMLSADSTMLSKIFDRTIHKKISEIAVAIAEDVVSRIDYICKEQPEN